MSCYTPATVLLCCLLITVGKCTPIETDNTSGKSESESESETNNRKRQQETEALFRHLVPPTIIDGPDYYDTYRPDDDIKELPCKVTGTQPINYTWLRNEVELNLRENQNIKINDGRLYLNNLNKPQEGYYQCLASNEAGTAMSNIILLQAAVLESNVSDRDRKTGRNMTVREFEHLVLPCNHIRQSIPKSIVQWEILKTGDHLNENEEYFEVVDLSKENRIFIAENGDLIFTYVRMDDSAIYKCNHYNGELRRKIGGSRVNLLIQSTRDADKKLRERPNLLYVSENVTIVEGKDFQLMCLFGSWPEPKVEWSRPDGRISDDIKIQNAKEADAGIYSCRAVKPSNLYSETTEIHVKVDAYPTFLSSMPNEEILYGKNATFRCQHQGRPTPTVSWYINGTSKDKLKGRLNFSMNTAGFNSSLILQNIRTSATVTCNISNVHGYRLQSAFVTIIASKNDDFLSSSSQAQSTTTTTTGDIKTSSKSSSIVTTTITAAPSTDLDKKEFDGSTKSDSAKLGKQTDGKTTTKKEDSIKIIIVVVAIFAVIIVVVVIIIICVRRRRQKTKSYDVSADPASNVPLREIHGDRLRDRDRQQNQDSNYDSEDSGLEIS